MVDIWHNIATSLGDDVDSALWKLRESPEYIAMGSEIERAFAARFEVMLRIGAIPHLVAKVPTKDCGFYLIPQYEVDQYRVDFVMGHSKQNFELRKSIVIECDGHDWHEKTKEQAAKDKKRDRFLQQHFGAVLHFTGSEIYRDSSGCLTDSIRALGAVLDRHK